MRNLRFNQSLIDALETCALSNDQHRSGGYSYARLLRRSSSTASPSRARPVIEISLEHGPGSKAESLRTRKQRDSGRVVTFSGGSIGSMADIDNWVKAELKLVFNGGPFDASRMLVYSRDGAVRWASDGLLQFLGYSRDDFDRGAIDWDGTTPPEYWTLVEWYIGQFERGEKTAYQYVQELTHKDGTRLAVRVRVARSESDEERILMFVTELTRPSPLLRL
jgi:PAS domain S-box-containing protein